MRNWGWQYEVGGVVPVEIMVVTVWLPSFGGSDFKKIIHRLPNGKKILRRNRLQLKTHQPSLIFKIDPDDFIKDWLLSPIISGFIWAVEQRDRIQYITMVANLVFGEEIHQLVLQVKRLIHRKEHRDTVACFPFLEKCREADDQSNCPLHRLIARGRFQIPMNNNQQKKRDRRDLKPYQCATGGNFSGTRKRAL